MSRTITVISVEVADAAGWRTEAERVSDEILAHGDDGHRSERVQQARLAAMTARWLGVPVGIVVGTREEQA